MSSTIAVSVAADVDASAALLPPPVPLLHALNSNVTETSAEPAAERQRFRAKKHFICPPGLSMW
ncbi:hypothetical protein [Rhodococcus wratislaviensis]|uniref:hypothetical protein n=1 Tax=Rhodococcus wratislaviensis TaxID=44752 RepID=UPI001788D0FA|nr:hypothetical protein [Rhodococcus wratislaviensis]